MRRLAFTLLFLAVAATAVMGARNSSIRYERRHMLLQDGQDINVVDIDVEWPERVDGFSTDALGAYLNENLLRLKTPYTDLESSLATFVRGFGKPVEGQFKELPDDRRFCYIDVKLREIGHLENRYISFRYSYQCTPAELSAQKGDTVSHYLTYDLQQGRVLGMRDLIRVGRIQNGYYDTSMVIELARNASIDFSDDMLGLSFVDGCMKDEGMTFSMMYISEEQIEPFTTYLSAANNRSMLSRQARAILEKAALAGPLSGVVADSVLQGAPIYNKVNKAPEFNFGGMTLPEYLSKNINIQAADGVKSGQSAVEVSFVVAADGSVSNVRVVSSASPELDREAARVVSLMPRWQAGTLSGKPVATALYLPIRFQSSK